MKLTNKQKEALRKVVGEQLDMVSSYDRNTQAAMIAIWIIGIIEYLPTFLHGLEEDE